MLYTENLVPNDHGFEVCPRIWQKQTHMSFEYLQSNFQSFCSLNQEELKQEGQLEATIKNEKDIPMETSDLKIIKYRINIQNKFYI